MQFDTWVPPMWMQRMHNARQREQLIAIAEDVKRELEGTKRENALKALRACWVEWVPNATCKRCGGNRTAWTSKLHVIDGECYQCLGTGSQTYKEDFPVEAAEKLRRLQGFATQNRR